MNSTLVFTQIVISLARLMSISNHSAGRGKSQIFVNRTKQFNRTQMKMAGSGMDRGAIMAFDNQGRNPVPTKKHRSRKADQAAADD